MMNYKNFAHLSFLVFKYLFENLDTIQWSPSKEYNFECNMYELFFAEDEGIHFITDKIMLVYNPSQVIPYNFHIYEKNQWHMVSFIRIKISDEAMNKIDFIQTYDSNTQLIMEYNKKNDVISLIVEDEHDSKYYDFNYPFTKDMYFNILMIAPQINCDYDVISDILNYELPKDHYFSIYNF